MSKAGTLRSCVNQLLATEIASIALFGALMRWPWQVYLAAPISILLLPIFAFENQDHGELALTVLIDIVFISVMTALIVRNLKRPARAILLLFTVASMLLVFEIPF
ncbi:MAG: hypothetical protein WAU82_02390 [Candidatus Binatus sp.]|uniref:hypothetical protein n=1 Tax=Candidatus Binatus sp. TaxID=2811406 RepID=UPI003BCFFF69